MNTHAPKRSVYFFVFAAVFFAAAIALFAGCSAQTLVVGTWVAPEDRGTSTIIFTAAKDFNAEFFATDKTSKKISGTYKVQGNLIVLTYDGQERYASFTLYSVHLDLLWEGRTIRFFRYK